MKKSVKILLFIAIISIAIFLAGCGKKECETSPDCTKAGYTSNCIDNKCIRTPIPGACGNGKCDQAENECSCASDCGVCSGSVPGSTLLQKTCTEDDVCTITVPTANIKPVSITNTINSQGNTFKITTTYNQPFNFKRDSFTTKVILDSVANFISNIRVTNYELSGVNKDKQNVVLVTKDISKPLAKGSTVEDDLHLGITTGDIEGILNTPILKINYEYTLTQGSSSQLKTAQIVNPLKGVTISWVLPPIDYDCPKDCNDNNDGTTDTCGKDTNFFCEHSPIPGACGNFECDGNENKCTCAKDCGQCSGSAGQYMDLSCKTDVCISTVRGSINVVPTSIFDDRNLNVFHLNNKFTYNKPFNVKDDRIKAEFTLYNTQATTSNINIDSIRVLDGTKELGFLPVSRQLTAVGQSFFVEVPITSVEAPESNHFTTLSVAYSYDQSGTPKKGTFTKPLEKITYITPGTV